MCVEKKKRRNIYQLTCDVLAHRGISLNQGCSLCHSSLETITHVLRDCLVAHGFWLKLRIPGSITILAAGWKIIVLQLLTLCCIVFLGKFYFLLIFGNSGFIGINSCLAEVQLTPPFCIGVSPKERNLLSLSPTSS